MYTHRMRSLDPLCEAAHAIHLGLSRWYHPGGSDLAREGFRPGFPDVADQLARLRRTVGSAPVTLIEDDMYTGETLASTVAELRASGINVKQVVVGIKICQTDLAIPGVDTAAAVRYKLDTERPLSEQIDLGDPRDYLIGLSGLVILLEKESAEGPILGRAPYLLPFVKPSDRASFPSDFDWELSLAVLKLSQDFYQRLSRDLGLTIRIKHCDPHFALMAAHELGVTEEDAMTDFIENILSDAPRLATHLMRGRR